MRPPSWLCINNVATARKDRENEGCFSVAGSVIKMPDQAKEEVTHYILWSQHLHRIDYLLCGMWMGDRGIIPKTGTLPSAPGGGVDEGPSL